MTHEVDCTQTGCNFSVRSDSESEIIDIVREHARENHDAEMSRGDVRDMIKTA